MMLYPVLSKQDTKLKSVILISDIRTPSMLANMKADGKKHKAFWKENIFLYMSFSPLMVQLSGDSEPSKY